MGIYAQKVSILAIYLFTAINRHDVSACLLESIVEKIYIPLKIKIQHSESQLSL